jgi:hypothetical protein
MLFNNGPKLDLNWLTPTLVVVVIVACVAVKFYISLPAERFVVLLANSVGTVLLASAFEPHLPKHGNGRLWESLKFAVKEFPKYGSPPAFDFVRFYAGLFLLLVGMLLSVLPT